MPFQAALTRTATLWAVAVALLLCAAPTLASVNPPATPRTNPPAERATMAPAQSTPEFDCYHYANGESSGRYSAVPPAGNHVLQDGVGGAAVGALAGSLSGKAGRGAVFGGLAGGLFGAFADASASWAWQRHNTQFQSAYDKCMREASSSLGS